MVDAVERIVAEDALVRADDLAVLERERVERSPELRLRQDERRGDPAALPVRRHGARTPRGPPIVSVADERQAGQRRVGVPVEVRTVGDDGSQPVAEDVAKIGTSARVRLTATLAVIADPF